MDTDDEHHRERLSSRPDLLEQLLAASVCLLWHHFRRLRSPRAAAADFLENAV